MKATGSGEGNGVLGIQCGADCQTYEGLRKQGGGQGTRYLADICVSPCRDRTSLAIIHYDGSSSAIRCFRPSGRRGDLRPAWDAVWGSFSELESVAGCSDLPGNPPQ